MRQAIFNALFGTGPAATAYYAASRLPDTIFNLIAGGALTHAFIPVLLSYEKEHDEREIWRLVSLVFNVLLVSLTAVLLVAELVAPTFVNSVLVPGLPPGERALTTTLTQIMLLQPLVLGVGTIATAILHSKRQFLPTALVLPISELGQIAGLLFSLAIPAVGIYGPTFGLFASAICQVVIQILAALKQGVRYTFIWDLRHPGLREVMHLLGPNVLTVAIGSIGVIVTTSFASYLPDKSSIAAMHNAYLLFALPLTLVTQTIGKTLLPPLTTYATHGRYVRMRWTVLKILGGVVLFSTPTAIALDVIGKPAIHILFQYGAFNQHSSTLTNLALIGYAVGLPGLTVGLLVVPAFYALKDAWTPLFINIVALGAQIGLSLFLLRVLTGDSAILALPLAASLTGSGEAAMLCLILFIRLAAKVKTDKGMQRLQQRRERSLISQEWEYTQQKQEKQVATKYQQLLQADPHNLIAFVQSHIAMMTSTGAETTTTLEGLNYICRQLRFEGQRKYEMVMHQYNQAAEAHPNNADVHFVLGQLYQQAGNYDKAINVYMLAMRGSAIEVLAQFSTAQCLLSQGKPEAAIQQLEQMQQTVRRTSTGAIDLSIWALRPRQQGEEHQTLERDISMLLARAHHRIERQGQVILHHKQHTKNISNALNDMVQQTSQDPQPHHELANIYMKRGLLIEAIAELGTLSDIYLRSNQLQQSGLTLRRIGNIHAKVGDTAEALMYLRRANELTPDDPNLLREIVDLCLQSGYAKDAAQYQMMIARHYVDTHQVEASVAALQKLITIDASNYEAYDLLGQIYQSIGKYG